jgi:hypothetical protein
MVSYFFCFYIQCETDYKTKFLANFALTTPLIARSFSNMRGVSGTIAHFRKFGSYNLDHGFIFDDLFSLKVDFTPGIDR